jgi:type VI secretion system secreted protein Hcp
MSVDYFLKIDGIDGESQDKTHGKEIELMGFNWSEAQSGTFAAAGGGGAGRVKMNDFVFTQRTNKATPKLLLACATGQHIKSVVLTCRKAGGGQQDFFKATMSDVLVSGFNIAAGDLDTDDDHAQKAGDEIPLETVSLNFAKIEVEYHPQKSDGSLDGPVKAGYDLKQNAAV